MIPLYDLDIGTAELERVEQVIESGQVADGPEVRSFESEFAEFCGTAHGVATSNGTTALHTAFHALGLGEGDYVITTPFSFVASANAIRHVGAEPLFADIKSETYNLNPTAVERLFEERGDDIAAVLAVHLYGLPAEMDTLQRLCDEYDAALVEDAAQAHGAEYDGQRTGSIGDIGCFSFYPTKNMTTSEGGMIVTDSDEIAETAAKFANHGREDRYRHDEVGYNFRMTSIEAAIGRSQLQKLPAFIERRRNNAEFLTERLRGCSIEVPTEPDERRHAYHQYTVRVEGRDAFQAFVSEQGIQTDVYYPRCIHNQPAYANSDVAAPVAERATAEVLSLPIHPNLSNAELKYIANAVKDYDAG